MHAIYICRFQGLPRPQFLVATNNDDIIEKIIPETLEHQNSNNAASEVLPDFGDVVVDDPFEGASPEEDVEFKPSHVSPLGFGPRFRTAPVPQSNFNSMDSSFGVSVTPIQVDQVFTALLCSVQGTVNTRIAGFNVLIPYFTFRLEWHQKRDW